MLSPSRTSAIGPAHSRFRGDVPDDHAVGPAGEPAVGDEPDRIAESGADDRRRRREHFTHAGSAARAFVPDDDDIAGLEILPARIAARHSSSESNTRAGPVMCGFLTPVIFATAPSGARLPAQDREMSLGVERRRPTGG